MTIIEIIKKLWYSSNDIDDSVNSYIINNSLFKMTKILRSGHDFTLYCNGEVLVYQISDHLVELMRTHVVSYDTGNIFKLNDEILFYLNGIQKISTEDLEDEGFVFNLSLMLSTEQYKYNAILMIKELMQLVKGNLAINVTTLYKYSEVCKKLNVPY